MRTTLVLIFATAIMLGASLGCEGEPTFIRGDWVGTVTYADESTQELEFAIFDRPGFIGPSEHLRVLLVISDATCAETVDYGLIKPEEDGTVIFPIQSPEANPCFPELATLDLLEGGSLELVTTGVFNGDADTAQGTLVIRQVVDGEPVSTIRDGTWTATRE